MSQAEVEGGGRETDSRAALAVDAFRVTSAGSSHAEVALSAPLMPVACVWRLTLAAPGRGTNLSASLQEERNCSGVTSTRMSVNRGRVIGKCSVASSRGCSVR